MQPRLEEAFAHLGRVATRDVTAVAQLVLPDGDLCTLRAGGHGVRARCSSGAWTSLEVLLSGDVPRYWHPYAADARSALFAYVPPLLVTHYVTRGGGLREMELTSDRRARTGVMDLKVALPEGAEAALQRALAMVPGAQVLMSNFSLSDPI